MLLSAGECQFCPKCGKELVTKKDGTRTSSSSESTPKRRACDSFASFKSKKSEERASRFRDVKGKANRGSTETPQKDIIINVGIMKYDLDNGSFTPARGKSLPLKINRNANYAQLLTAALIKRKAYDQSFNDELDWNMVYPDGQTAISLPGQPDIPFILKAYKEDLGKLYSRIALYLYQDEEVNKNETCDNGENVSCNTMDLQATEKKISNMW